MGYNYTNVKGSIQEQENEEAAKNGKLPEGKYKFQLTNVEYGKENKSGARVWIWKCLVIAPGTIYHRAERQIRFSEREDYFAKEQFKKMISHMEQMGVSFDSMVTGPTQEKAIKQLQEIFAVIADSKIKFDVEVTDQVDKDGNVHNKYQNFDIVEESLPDVNFDEYMEEHGLIAKKAPAAPAAPAPAPAAAPVADEVPPPAPRRRSPYPEPQNAD